MTNKASYVALILAAAAFILVVARPTSDANNSLIGQKETTFEHVMRTHTIRCGYAMWNPVIYKDLKTGQIKGIARDVMDALGKKLDLRIDWAEETGWSTLIEGLATHRYDAICHPVLKIAARSRAIDFSVPVFYAPSCIVVRKNETRLAKNDDLNNPTFTFAVLDGEASSFLVPKKFPKAHIDSLPQNADFSLVFQEVETKKADATVVAASDFYEYEKANPGKLKILDSKDPVHIGAVAFGLPQGDVAMKTMFDTALNELLEDGTVLEATKAYVESPDMFIPPSKPYAASMAR